MYMSDILKTLDCIHIEYIVENSAVEGFVTIPRDSEAFPDSDVMIIADIMNYEKISAKLISRYNGDVITIEEMISEVVGWKG